MALRMDVARRFPRRLSIQSMAVHFLSMKSDATRFSPPEGGVWGRKSDSARWSRRDRGRKQDCLRKIVYRFCYDIPDCNLRFEVLRQQMRADCARLPLVKKLAGGHVPHARRGRRRRTGCAPDRQGHSSVHRRLHPWAEEDPSCADYKRAFINPEIYALSEEKKTYNEGCLSFPGIHADVARSLSIRMRYMDHRLRRARRGVPRDSRRGSSSTSTTTHEGVVFTDRIARCAVSCSRASCSTSPRAQVSLRLQDPLTGRRPRTAGRVVFGSQPVTRLHVTVFAARHEKSRTSKGPGFFVCRLLRIRIGMRHRC